MISEHIIIKIAVRHYLVNTAIVAMKLVIAKLILDPYPYEKCAGNANRQSYNIGRRKSFVSEYVSPADLEVTFEHSVVVCGLCVVCRADNAWSEQQEHIDDEPDIGRSFSSRFYSFVI